MKYLCEYNNFGMAVVNSSLPNIDRTKELSNEEFLSIIKDKCSNYSLDKDQLYRNRNRKFDLELFTPNYRNADPLAFKDFFNSIEDSDDHPVKRKKSLIGGTNDKLIKRMVGNDNYIVIPFDNSEIIFCPSFDLWSFADRGEHVSNSVSTIGGKPIDSSYFIKVIYDSNFKIPSDELESIKKVINSTRTGKETHGYEFFTSSPCLLVHESKFEWLKKTLSVNESVNYDDIFTEMDADETDLFEMSKEKDGFSDSEKESIRKIFSNIFTSLEIGFGEHIYSNYISFYFYMDGPNYRITDINITISKYEDEWFILNIIINNDETYYKCDSLDIINKLEDFINSKIEYYL